MKKKYNVLIVGTGNIGAFFDTPLSKDILTHAHAFSKLEEFNLLGFVDIDYDKAEKAADIWHVKAFKSVEEAFKDNIIDVVSICVPDEFHFQIMKELLKYDIKLIFLEKPLAKTLSEGKKILSLYDDIDTSVLVNYSRRFVKEFDNLKEEFNQGLYGSFLCGNAYYGKGLLHNGSHLIDFLMYIIGDIHSSIKLKSNIDFYEDDPSITGLLRFDDNATITINNIPCNNYTVFEIDLFFERKRIRIVDSGFDIEIYDVGKSERFKGYEDLNRVSKYSTELGLALENAALNIYNHLEYGEVLKCTLEDAYKAMEICDDLRGKSCE